MNAAHRLIATRLEFHEALREAFAEIADTGCREVFLSDEDFADWPLNEMAVVEQLSQWAHSHRKLTVLARNFDEFPRRHPRWIEWRRQWSHVVECRALDPSEAGPMPVLLVAPGLVTVRISDPIRHRGSVSREAVDLVQNREAVDAVLQHSSEAFPVTILGL